MSLSNDSQAPPTVAYADIPLPLDPTPEYMKLSDDDLVYVTKKLYASALQIRLEGPRHPDYLFVSHTSFLSPNFVTSITTDFLQIKDKDDFKQRMTGWRYWALNGDALYADVASLVDEMKRTLQARHEKSLEDRREKPQS